MFPIDKKYHVDPLFLDRPETLALSIITERSFNPFFYVKNIMAILTIARLFQERIFVCLSFYIIYWSITRIEKEAIWPK